VRSAAGLLKDWCPRQTRAPVEQCESIRELLKSLLAAVTCAARALSLT